MTDSSTENTEERQIQFHHEGHEGIEGNTGLTTKSTKIHEKEQIHFTMKDMKLGTKESILTTEFTEDTEGKP